MRRGWLLWMVFGLCIAMAFAAMAWISLTVLRLERQAQAEENVRLALWRMDSAMSPLIAQETARPYFAYSSFRPAERAYTRMFNEVQYGEVLVPSPLLVNESPLILLHFQIEPNGVVSSPQVPTGNLRDLASKSVQAREAIRGADRLLGQFSASLKPEVLAAALPPNEPDGPPLALGNTLNYAAPANDALVENSANQLSQAVQEQRSVKEWQARSMSNVQAQMYNPGRQSAVLAENRSVREGVMRPLWMGDRLVLGRRVTIDEADYFQGVWLNWDAIRGLLLESTRDLLPEARLLPGTTDSQDRQSRRLASLPVMLMAGGLSARASWTFSPIELTLLAAWACVMVGSVAVGALLLGAIRLSERRGAFVSAVTHELRTPLTTVNMYAEMLEEGMVRDEPTRKQYLATLRGEAHRLGHLVENVLAYSRIERGRARARIEPLPLPQLIEGVKGRLVQRAEQAGMRLCVTLPGDASEVTVRADASAVEQILFNLVDNAAKYAASAADRDLHLEAEGNGRFATIRLRDHGPGISQQESRRLFRPFCKSAKDAANSALGVGLGLALSRRLAREMHGDLTLQQGDGDGAAFVLRLPLATG